MLLSVVIPVYNERETIEGVILKVQEVEIAGIRKEILIVDDGSTDGTTDYLRAIQDTSKLVTVLFHEKNRGKGAAIRTAFAESTGDIIVVHDADNEYDPHDFPALIKPILENNAQVVYGSRFLGGYKASSWKYHLANILLTKLTSVIFFRRMTDVYTCYKCFTREVHDSLHLTSNSFEIEAELTAKLLRGGWDLVEVPISYTPRGVQQGKKINAFDFLKGVFSLIKFRLV